MKKLTRKDGPTVIAGGWITLSETVKLLGRSQSTVERLVLKQAIGSRLEVRAGRKPERLYSEADVERLAAENKAVMTTRSIPAVNGSASGGKLGESKPVTIAALESAVEKWIEHQQQPRERVPLLEKLTLTIAEASAYTGLGESFLLGLIDTRAVRALKAGPHGSWVIERTSLEECVRGLFGGDARGGQ